ncbi:hypothetical protein P4576_10950 [Peribacillus frigoritolerans]|uniref:hypothetical protein n=1 Tax=Peribacillus frigoritolerans TaxID=450367 RepID=UPI002E235EC7|nr:hypothetical protein [Peribacillus frigoritolerans]
MISIVVGGEYREKSWNKKSRSEGIQKYYSKVSLRLNQHEWDQKFVSYLATFTKRDRSFLLDDFVCIKCIP